MRKLVTFLLCTVLAGSALFAQNTVLDVREAHPGKDLTMEEAIYKGVGLSRIPSDRMPSTPSPAEGSFTVFSENGSLYIKDRGKDAPTIIAESTDPGIVYGEIVSRNEFGIDAGWYVSPDSTKIAFYKKDQSKVKRFPLLDIGIHNGDLKEIFYPMNGGPSEKVFVGIYDIPSGKTAWLEVKEFSSSRYITNISWCPDSRYIYAQILDRSQHSMHLNSYRASDGRFIRTILEEENDAWVEPLDPIYFLKGRKDVFIYRTDNRDGFRSLYLVDTIGTIRRLPTASADIKYLDNDGSAVYYTSAENSPVQNHLYKMRLKVPGKNAVSKAAFYKPVQLTSGRGWHNVILSPDCKEFTDIWSNFSTPVQMWKRSTDGKKSELFYEGEDPLADYASCKVEFGTIPSADSSFQNYYRLFYPKDFDPQKKYPLIVYVYGGPHSQMVTDSWLGKIRMWEMLMAQKGYIVYVQDNRGTENRGAAFEKAINRQCGKAEMEDQMVGINWLRSLPFVDSERIGVHGWSYGGFMTISLMTTYPDVFKVGVAGGPVIDWKWYEVMYGERYMDNPQTNYKGFLSTSLIPKAKNLKGHLLICQGAMDETVVWEHSLSFIQECIDNGIPVDYFPYPTAKHNVFGRNRIHLMDKVTQYFEDYL
ncbi:MAG: DPP IV N-terminal domain-containing protein [Bacteroidales bacterium]|nr:DPP IV N-terminal domain-containing protein [Bacteroidales bacterium]